MNSFCADASHKFADCCQDKENKQRRKQTKKNILIYNLQIMGRCMSTTTMALPLSRSQYFDKQREETFEFVSPIELVEE